MKNQDINYHGLHHTIPKYQKGECLYNIVGKYVLYTCMFVTVLQAATVHPNFSQTVSKFQPNWFNTC